MKTQNPFALPIPPLGQHTARCCMRDWKLAAERAGLWKRDSKWVFASRVMQSGAGDIAVSGSALANHLRNMRGLREGNHRDVPRGIPHFSMHIIRSTLGDHILDETGLPPGTASRMIGHEIAGDRRNELDRMGQTGKRLVLPGTKNSRKDQGDGGLVGGAAGRLQEGRRNLSRLKIFGSDRRTGIGACGKRGISNREPEKRLHERPLCARRGRSPRSALEGVACLAARAGTFAFRSA